MPENEVKVQTQVYEWYFGEEFSLEDMTEFNRKGWEVFSVTPFYGQYSSYADHFSVMLRRVIQPAKESEE